MKRPRLKPILKTTRKQTAKLRPVRKLSRLQAIVYGVVFAGLGGYVIHMSLAATVSCDLSATTANFSSQLNAAQPGQTLCLATGNYGTFKGVAKASPGVTITAASGASPTMVIDFRNASTAISWLTIDNVTIKGGDIAGPAHDIKISNSNITAEFNFWQAGGIQNNACSSCAAMINSNIVMDHDVFNMADSASGPGLYEGRLSFIGPTSGNTGVTVKNSVFRDNCADGIMFAEGGEGVTIGPGNEFTNLNQNLEPPSLISGDCGPHVDSIQLGTMGRPVITGNYFHNNSTGIASYDWDNSAIITDNVFDDIGQDEILAGGYDSNSIIEHNTVRGGTIYCATTHQNDTCHATIRNNIMDEMQLQPGSSPTVNDYNLCKFSCGTGGGHNITGSPTYSGGSAPSTLAGFALAGGSLGKSGASDGKDIGATYFGGTTCNLNATTANFSSQVSAAADGQTICLASGDYGTWNGTNKAITITEQTNATATIKLNIGQSDGNFTIDGLTIGDSNISGDSNNYANPNNPKNITIKNSAFTGPMNIEYVTNSNILLDNNTHININSCTNGCRPAAVQLSYGSNTFSGVTVQNSLFQGGNADGIQTGAGLNIINNKFIDVSEHGNDDLHTDPIQIIGAKGTVVRGNYLYNTSDGIVAYDGIDSALIENNVIDLVNGRWGIELYSDKNSIVRHNTLKYGTGCSYAPCGVITVDHKTADPAGSGTQIYDNIATEISANNGSVIARQDHNLIRNGGAAGDLTGSPTYSGGANPTNYAGFGLASGSAGKGAASDGSDIGINTSGGTTGGGGDTTLPTVSLTAPANGSTVSGSSVQVTANASDNVGVAGVQFKLDGANLGSEDTSSPYAVTWNAVTASNGSHVLTAVARDAAGNTATSSSVTVTVTGGTSVLLGNANVESAADSNSTGEAEAFKYTASGSGTAGSLNLYVGNSTSATTIKVGIYSNSSNHPGSLLASGIITNPAKGAWNTASLSPAVTITSGTVYWIAILGTNGSVAYVNQSSGSCSEGTSATGLTNLSATWASGTGYVTCKISAYVVASTGGGSPGKTGDFNSDGVVNIYDLGIFLSKWLNTNASSQDLNSDGIVNIYDLGIFLSNYGT